MFSCNMLVLSYIHILWAISGLIGSRVFSGFFLARSVHKGGDFYRMTVYKVPVTVKKIKTFLKNALVFDMEFYFGHIIIHTYVRTSLYVCITIWEYTCTNMFSDAGKTYFGIPYIFASNLTLVFAFFIFSSDTFLGGLTRIK